MQSEEGSHVYCEVCVCVCVCVRVCVCACACSHSFREKRRLVERCSCRYPHWNSDEREFEETEDVCAHVQGLFVTGNPYFLNLCVCLSMLWMGFPLKDGMCRNSRLKITLDLSPVCCVEIKTSASSLWEISTVCHLVDESSKYSISYNCIMLNEKAGVFSFFSCLPLRNNPHWVFFSYSVLLLSSIGLVVSLLQQFLWWWTGKHYELQDAGHVRLHISIWLCYFKPLLYNN